jgi:fatty acid amide hydrolase
LRAARGTALDAAGGEVLEARIAEYRRTFALALDGQALDAVICPVYPVPAVLHGGSGDVIRGQSYSSLWNLLGYPAGVVPVTTVAESEDRGAARLPVGVQIAARPWREDAVIGLMRAVADSTLPSVGARATLGNSRLWYGRGVAHRVRRR